MLSISHRSVALFRVQNPPICGNFWHRTYCHYFNFSCISPNDVVIQNKWERIWFLHVWVFLLQIAYASAQILEPAGCGDLALLIMQTKRSIMDHKCHVTKMQASVTESTRENERFSWKLHVLELDFGWAFPLLSCSWFQAQHHGAPD